METVLLREGESFIRLGQAMKKAGMVISGSEATALIADGNVSVNGEVERRRGKKLYDGDTFAYGTRQITITA